MDKMTKAEAIELFKKQLDNEAFSPEMKLAMQIAIVSMAYMNSVERGPLKKMDAKKKETQDSCKYFSRGRCTGQKGMPECTPNRGYCPCKKDGH